MFSEKASDPALERFPAVYAEKLRSARARRTMQGERRVVTILFCDIVGSTEIASQLDPEEWAEIMQEAFETLTGPIYRYEGTVARLMGDGLLAFFGAPIAHEDDPQRAIFAALDIIADLRPFGAEVRRDYGFDLKVRVGINTGPVVVGEVGADLAMEYTALGDAINLAARMEQTAEPGTVQITEETLKRIAPFFEVESRGPIEVKGKRAPEEVYCVLAPKAEPGSLRGIEGLSAPLIGRMEETATLNQALEDLRAGRGGILALIGAAGLGKTRLLEEFRSQAAAGGSDAPERWLRAAGVSYDHSQPFGLFRRLLQALLEIEDQTDARTAIHKADQILHDLPLASPTRVREAIEVLLDLGEETEFSELEGDLFRQQLSAAFMDLFRAIALQGPMLLLLDDLHWADSASIELLLDLFQLCDQAPILFLCSMRPYRRSTSWQIRLKAETDFPHRYIQVELQPLAERESRQLVESLLRMAQLPDDIEALILSKSEGNPLFVEEVVRMLIQQGVLAPGSTAGGQWVASMREIVIPDNLRGLLVARIDRLPVDVRRTLQLASVIGRDFSQTVLERVTDGDDLLKHLGVLQRTGIVLEVARKPEVAFTFKHELLRDAAYSTILRRQRRRYHRQVAEVLEELNPESTQEIASRLAEHFARAGEQARAYPYAIQAARRAMELHAPREASEHYGAAAALAADLDLPHESLINLYLQYGRAYELLGDFEKALDVYAELTALGRKQGDDRMELASLLQQATIFTIPTSKYDQSKSRATTERAYDLATKIGDAQAQAKALWNRMLIHFYHEGDLDGAIRLGEQALELSQRSDLREERAFILHDLSRVYSHSANVRRAIELQREAAAAFRGMGNLPMLADSLTTGAYIFFSYGDLDRAERQANEAHGISLEIGNSWGEAFSLMSLGGLMTERGNLNAAAEALERAHQLGRKTHFFGAELLSIAILAWAYGSYGLLEQAGGVARRARAASRGSVDYEARAQLIHAWIRLHAGDLEQACTLADRANPRLSRHVPDLFVSGVIVYMRGEIAIARGDIDDACAIAERQLAFAEGGAQALFRPDALRVRALAEAARGDHERAGETFSLALDAAQTIGSRRSEFAIYSAAADLAQREGAAFMPDSWRDQGKELVSWLADQIGPEDLRARFLSSAAASFFAGAS